MSSCGNTTSLEVFWAFERFMLELFHLTSTIRRPLRKVLLFSFFLNIFFPHNYCLYFISLARWITARYVTFPYIFQLFPPIYRHTFVTKYILFIFQFIAPDISIYNYIHFHFYLILLLASISLFLSDIYGRISSDHFDILDLAFRLKQQWSVRQVQPRTLASI